MLSQGQIERQGPGIERVRQILHIVIVLPELSNVLAHVGVEAHPRKTHGKKRERGPAASGDSGLPRGGWPAKPTVGLSARSPNRSARRRPHPCDNILHVSSAYPTKQYQGFILEFLTSRRLPKGSLATFTPYSVSLQANCSQRFQRVSRRAAAQRRPNPRASLSKKSTPRATVAGAAHSDWRRWRSAPSAQALRLLSEYRSKNAAMSAKASRDSGTDGPPRNRAWLSPS